MEETKYGHLVKPLSVGKMDMQPDESAPERNFAMGPGNADKLVWLNGRDHLEGLNVNFTWGFYSGIGEWHTAMDPHTHPYPECLVFVGLDPSNIEYLGAEIEIALGEEQEKHTFDKPSVVVVPAGFPHCPLVTKRVDNPKGFAFYLISLGAEPETTWLGGDVTEEQAAQIEKMGAERGMKMHVDRKAKLAAGKPAQTDGKKYAHLIKPMTPMLGPEGIRQDRVPGGMVLEGDEAFILGPGNADQLVWMYGKDLEGLNLNFTWGFYSKPGIWHRRETGRGAHVHPEPELLVFVGLDPDDIDYLGAEIETDMGKEHESHVVNKPSVYIVPGGLPHLPVVTRWVDKPYSFIVISLSDLHAAPFID